MALPPSQSNHIGRPENRRVTLRDFPLGLPRGCTDINVPLDLLAIQVNYLRRFIVFDERRRAMYAAFHRA
jgi:hypothetical protein